MIWRKLGHVWVPDASRPWARVYALMPTPELRGDRLRLYVAALDEHRFGRVTWVEVDPHEPTRVVAEAPRPALDLGSPGLFDDSGVNPSSLVEWRGERRLYYVGWQRTERVPYLLFSGVAVEREDGRFERVAAVPVLERTAAEPWLRSAPSVLPEAGGLRAWYVCGLGWTEVAGRALPTYGIRTAWSPDGLRWPDAGETCIAAAEDDEFGFGRPWVVRDGAGYGMWYSIRSRTRPYRIGYAVSTDGLRWQRRDAEAGLERSAEGWDSEMICYLSVVDVGGRQLAFYNGNRHGETGFGVAERVG